MKFKKKKFGGGHGPPIAKCGSTPAYPNQRVGNLVSVILSNSFMLFVFSGWLTIREREGEELKKEGKPVSFLLSNNSEVLRYL